VGSANAASLVVAVLVCYLDDSGEESEPIITLAGFMSLYPFWEDFERKAAELFRTEQIKYLHTVDFHHSKGQFDGWHWERKKAFAHEFFAILNKNCGLGAEFSVIKGTYKKRMLENSLKRANSAFGFCFMGLINRLVKDESVSQLLTAPEIDLSFVVENGHRNNKDLLAIFNRAKAHPQGGIFNSIAFEDKESHRIAGS
jgi:hypothetical protein